MFDKSDSDSYRQKTMSTWAQPFCVTHIFSEIVKSKISNLCKQRRGVYPQASASLLVSGIKRTRGPRRISENVSYFN